jgi:Ca2+-transporting ATPase
VLSRAPRLPSSGVFDRPLTVRTVTLAVAIAAVSLGVAIWSRAVGGPWQTQLFVTLTVAQLALALVLRPGGAWHHGGGALWLPAAVGANLVLLVAGVYLAGLSGLLRTEAIGMAEFAVAAVAGLVPSGLLLLARLASVLGRSRSGVSAQADQVQARTSGRSSSSSTT